MFTQSTTYERSAFESDISASAASTRIMFLIAAAALSYAPGLTPPAVSSRVSAVSMKGFDQEVRDVAFAAVSWQL